MVPPLQNLWIWVYTREPGTGVGQRDLDITSKEGRGAQRASPPSWPGTDQGFPPVPTYTTDQGFPPVPTYTTNTTPSLAPVETPALRSSKKEPTRGSQIWRRRAVETPPLPPPRLTPTIAMPPMRPRHRPASRKPPAKGRLRFSNQGCRPSFQDPCPGHAGSIQPPPTPARHQRGHAGEEDGRVDGRRAASRGGDPALHPAAYLHAAARGAPSADPCCPRHRRCALGRRTSQGTLRGGGMALEEVAA
jgi:hypothetical protein